ncbi:MAG: DMT family transporter [Pseudomonadota bacterium]
MTQSAIPSSGPGALAWMLLLTLGVIWGSSFMLTNIAVIEVPPVTLSALRLALAAVLIGAAVVMTGGRLPRLKGDGRLWRFAFLSAVLGNVLPFCLISWSQLHIPSALTGILMAPMPLVSLFLAHLMLAGERMTTGRFVGFFIGLGGLVILIGGDALSGVEGSGLALLGQIASLVAMLCYALNGIALKRAAAPDPLGISFAILTLAALIAVPLALIVEAPVLADYSASAWITVGALGLGATALAQIILMKIIDLAGPPFLATVNFQVPLWATVFGVVFLGEILPETFWIALGLILLGLAIAQFAGRLGTTRNM